MKNLFTRWFASACLIYACLLFGEERMDDMSLALPMEELERLVSMTGELQLQVMNRDPEDPLQGTFDWWVLKLDTESFEKACTTPVHGAFQSPESIRGGKQSNELGLTGDYDKNWLRAHLGSTVTLSGYLWHAHTAHHHSLVMMDTDPW